MKKLLEAERKEKERYEALYWARIDSFNRLKDAWKAHSPDWDMIDKIAKNIINNTKPQNLDSSYIFKEDE